MSSTHSVRSSSPSAPTSRAPAFDETKFAVPRFNDAGKLPAGLDSKIASYQKNLTEKFAIPSSQSASVSGAPPVKLPDLGNDTAASAATARNRLAAIKGHLTNNAVASGSKEPVKVPEEFQNLNKAVHNYESAFEKPEFKSAETKLDTAKAHFDTVHASGSTASPAVKQKASDDLRSAKSEFKAAIDTHIMPAHTEFKEAQKNFQEKFPKDYIDNVMKTSHAMVEEAGKVPGVKPELIQNLQKAMTDVQLSGGGGVKEHAALKSAFDELHADKQSQQALRDHQQQNPMQLAELMAANGGGTTMSLLTAGMGTSALISGLGTAGSASALMVSMASASTAFNSSCEQKLASSIEKVSEFH